MEWQPIETAPNDGTSILVTGGSCFNDGGGSGFCHEYALNGVRIAWYRSEGWCLGYGEGYNDEIWASPKWWMPLPKAPE